METNESQTVALDYFRAVASAFVEFVVGDVLESAYDELVHWNDDSQNDNYGKHEDYRFLLKILRHNKKFRYETSEKGLSYTDATKREKIIHAIFDKPNMQPLVQFLNSKNELIMNLIKAGNTEAHCVFRQHEYRKQFIYNMRDLIRGMKPHCNKKGEESPANIALKKLDAIDKEFDAENNGE